MAYQPLPIVFVHIYQIIDFVNEYFVGNILNKPDLIC